MKKITDRIDNITGIKPEQLRELPSCPRSVKIELTAKCNFQCSFCAVSQNLRTKGEMNKEFYRKLLIDIRQSGAEEIGLFYLGESFLVSWLPDAIRWAKDTGFPYVFITTNGSLTTQSKLNDVMAAGLDSLKFSINYADAEQFSSVAKVKPAYFTKMVQSVKDAWSIRENHGYDCGIFASYIKYNDAQDERISELIEKHVKPYCDEVYALPLYSQAGLTGEDNAEDGMEVRAGNPGRADNMRAPVPCWSLFTEARVSFDGHLSACCFDHDKRFRMGDLNKMSFMEAWHSEKFQELRAVHITENLKGSACEQCVAYN